LRAQSTVLMEMRGGQGDIELEPVSLSTHFNRLSFLDRLSKSGEVCVSTSSLSCLRGKKSSLTRDFSVSGSNLLSTTRPVKREGE
jgi:hypothetical protein